MKSFSEGNGLTQAAKNLGGVISQNSPTILTGIAVAGLVGTVVFAVKATPKALSIMDQELDNRGYYNDSLPDMILPDLTKMEIIKLTWKCYIPAVSMGIITIACIISANNISLRRNAALASLYGLTEAAFKEYQSKVVETIGKNKELKVRDDISADRVKNNPISKNEVVFTGKGSVICYDSLSGRYFKNDIEQIRRVVNDLNHSLMNDGFMTLNELYYGLGLSANKLGDEMGWDLDKGLVEISFSTQLTGDNEPCIVLNYDVVPKFRR